MPNPYFRFKQFTVAHDRCAMKVTTDACFFGAWCAEEIQTLNIPFGKALDIGTGTGLLSLMVAQKNKLHIDAVEIDKEAAGQAAENVAASPWNEKIYVVQKNVLDLPFEKYTVVFSNPPFYQNEIASQQTKKNLAHHGEGLLLNELFSFIAERLQTEGAFFVLLPAKRMKETETLLRRNNLLLQKKVAVRQTPNHLPFRYMISGTKGFEKVEEEKGEMVIQANGKEYAPEFVHLLKDYYLYL